MAKKKEIKKASGDISRAKAPSSSQGMVFGPENYKWMLIGLGVIVLGFILMYGPTDDIFESSEALKNASFSFSTHIKITLAPIVVLSGFVIEVFAIMKRPKSVDGAD